MSTRDDLIKENNRLRRKVVAMIRRHGNIRLDDFDLALPAPPDESPKKRTYTIPEKSFLRQAARGVWIGSEFMDHGRKMEVTAVGQVRVDGKERLIDITATEIES
jgi:hypothetical protein